MTLDLVIHGAKGTNEFVGYIVDDTHIKLVEVDHFVGSTAGQAIGQGAAIGTFTDNTAFSGTFVYGVSSISSVVASAGLFTADGAGNLTAGVADENVAGFVISDTFTGTYAVDTTGTGRTPAATTFDDPANGAGPTLIFYLTGNGNPPLVLNAEPSSPILAAGIALPQAAGPFDFNGPYGLNFSEQNFPFAIEGTAQVTADAVGATFTGTADINVFQFIPNLPPTITPNPDVAASGTFTSSADGHFASTLTVDPLAVSTALYFADSTQGFIIENDDLGVALGTFVTQQ